MRCESAQEYFSDYCDGTMLGAVKIPFENHLNGCGPCRDELDDLKRIWQALDRMPSVDPPPALRAVVWQRIDTDAKARSEGRRIRVPSFDWRALFAPRRLAWAAAGALVVALAWVAVPGPYQRAWLGFFGVPGVSHNTGATASAVAAGTPIVRALGAEQEITIPLRYQGSPTRATIRLLTAGEIVSGSEVELESDGPVNVIVRASAQSSGSSVRLLVTPIGDPSRAQTVSVPLP